MKAIPFPTQLAFDFTDEESFDLILDLGEAYLKAVCIYHQSDISIYRVLPEYWQWFIQILQQADELAFNSLTLDSMPILPLLESKRNAYCSLVSAYYQGYYPNDMVHAEYKRKYKELKALKAI
jgi:hypothetical protein